MTRRQILRAAMAAAAAASIGCEGLAPAAGPPGESFEVVKTEDEWRNLLSPEAFKVLRKHGTERAGSSPLDDEKRTGRFHCAGCDLPLFESKTKFDSGTGWPSFHTPIDKAVGTTEDSSLFMTRVEVHCRRCGGHLGHVFPDGPPPTGQRYCMNGVSLRFAPEGTSGK